MTPSLFNKHRPGDWSNATYIGRGSKWGNPFVIGKDGTRDEVIARYVAWFLSQPDLVAAAQRELRGQNLVCYCAPRACHGEILLQVANASTCRA